MAAHQPLLATMPVHAMQHHFSASHACAPDFSHGPAGPQSHSHAIWAPATCSAAMAVAVQMHKGHKKSKGAGTVPVEWGTQLPALQYLYLSQNNFTGADASIASPSCHLGCRENRIHSCNQAAPAPLVHSLPLPTIRTTEADRRRHVRPSQHDQAHLAERMGSFCMRVAPGLTRSRMPAKHGVQRGC